MCNFTKVGLLKLHIPARLLGLHEHNSMASSFVQAELAEANMMTDHLKKEVHTALLAKDAAEAEIEVGLLCVFAKQGHLGSWTQLLCSFGMVPSIIGASKCMRVWHLL